MSEHHQRMSDQIKRELGGAVLKYLARLTKDTLHRLDCKLENEAGEWRFVLAPTLDSAGNIRFALVMRRPSGSVRRVFSTRVWSETHAWAIRLASYKSEPEPVLENYGDW